MNKAEKFVKRVKNINPTFDVVDCHHTVMRKLFGSNWIMEDHKIPPEYLNAMKKFYGEHAKS